MLAEPPARGVRIGGVTVMPGEARAVAIPLASPRRRGTDSGPERSVPAWVVVGAKPGPRVSIVGAARGGEGAAARAAMRLAVGLEPATLSGSVVIVPVLWPYGRLPLRHRPDRAWDFPGDAGGTRAERDAFALFSDVVVGAQAVVVLGGPRRGRRGAVVAHGRLDDPRVRRLAVQTGAEAVLATSAKARGLLAAAAAAGIPCVELVAEGGPDDERAPIELARAARSSLAVLGILGKPEGDANGVAASVHGTPRVGAGAPAALPLLPSSPIVTEAPVRVRSPADGFLAAPVGPGTRVRAGAPLGRLVSTLPAPHATIAAPIRGLVIEAAPPGPVRLGAVLFVMTPLSRAAARKPASTTSTTTAAAGGDAEAVSPGRPPGGSTRPWSRSASPRRASAGSSSRAARARHRAAQGEDRHGRAHVGVARRPHADRRHVGRAAASSDPRDHGPGRRAWAPAARRPGGRARLRGRARQRRGGPSAAR